MHDLVICGGVVVNHDEMYGADIGVDDGRFSAIYQPGKAPASRQRVDAAGLFVFPGFIDPHVHIGYPDRDWQDDCTATTQAAAAGGVTTVIDFLAGENSIKQQLAHALDQMACHAWVDIAYHAGVFTWEHVRQIEEAAGLGLSSIKLYLPYQAKDTPADWRLTDDKLWESLCRVAGLGAPAVAMIHAENQMVIDHINDMAGDTPGETWSAWRPAFAEAEAISRVGHFSQASHCPIYIAHVGSAEAVSELKRLQRRGCRALGETCAHYLMLNNENCDPYKGKINPPLRTAEDNEAVWKGIADGVLQCIGSDHSSCSLMHKNGLQNGIPGFAGVQTTLPVLLDGAHRRKLTLPQIAAIFSYNTAKAFGLSHCKGAVRVGLDADFVLVDIDKRQKVCAAQLLHSADYSPFEGMELTGWPVATYLRGEKVAEHGAITGKQPAGRFIPRFCR